MGFMGRLCMDTDNCRGIVGDVFIEEGEAAGAYEFGIAMGGFLLGGICEDGHEGMDFFQLVVRNYHEEREKTLLDGKEVIIGWLPFKGGEGVGGLFERRVIASGVML
jgi:hypothetical protein